MSCCGSDKSIKNGRTYYGEQRCKSCGRQYIAGNSSTFHKRSGTSLLISFSGGITRDFLQVAFKIMLTANSVPQEVEVMPKKRGPSLLVQMDEMWSFVFKKDLKAWIWIARQYS